MEWFLTGLKPRLPRCLGGVCRASAGRRSAATCSASYLKRLCHPDPAVHLPAARAWSQYEGSCSTLAALARDGGESFAQDRTALGLARIEAHYFAHDLFLPPEGLLGRIDRLAGIPAEIVQGRYDMVCPPETAFDLAAAWPGRPADGGAGCGAFGPGTGGAHGAGEQRWSGSGGAEGVVELCGCGSP